MTVGIRAWLIAVAVWLGLAATATAAERAKMLEWNSSSQAFRNYSKDGVTLKFQRISNDDNNIKLTISMRGVPSYTIRLHDTESISYAITPIDPKHSKRDVLILKHPLNDYGQPLVFSLIHGRWHEVDLGASGTRVALKHVPKINRNGHAVFRSDDTRFYALGAAHCCFGRPTRFQVVDNGKIRDVSIDPAFSTTFEKEARDFKEECVSSDEYRNDRCAAYVAASARLGRFREAWEVMLRHYNRASDMEMNFCLSKEYSDNCHRWSPTTTSLPEILGPFLKARGYISQTELDSVQPKEEKAGAKR